MGVGGHIVFERGEFKVIHFPLFLKTKIANFKKNQKY